jgi:hypothetical protein
MRVKYFSVVMAFFASVSLASAQQSLQDVNWLKGTWKRLNGKPGTSGIEQWTNKSDSVLVGKGITLNGIDTVFVENIKIVLRGGILYYVADVAENSAPVPFKFTMVKSTAFVCENKMHDFPKAISYQLTDEKLKAAISGNGKSIEYWFERVK